MPKYKESHTQKYATCLLKSCIAGGSTSSPFGQEEEAYGYCRTPSQATSISNDENDRTSQFNENSYPVEDSSYQSLNLKEEEERNFTRNYSVSNSLRERQKSTASLSTLNSQILSSHPSKEIALEQYINKISKVILHLIKNNPGDWKQVKWEIYAQELEENLKARMSKEMVRTRKCNITNILNPNLATILDTESKIKLHITSARTINFISTLATLYIVDLLDKDQIKPKTFLNLATLKEEKITDERDKEIKAIHTYANKYSKLLIENLKQVVNATKHTSVPIDPKLAKLLIPKFFYDASTKNSKQKLKALVWWLTALQMTIRDKKDSLAQESFSQRLISIISNLPIDIENFGIGIRSHMSKIQIERILRHYIRSY